MQITSAATEPAPGSTNEDLYRTGNGYALVLDGAGRYPGEAGGCVHPVTWVVSHLAEHIGHQLDDERSSLVEVVRAAIEATVADHGPQCDTQDPLSPGAAGAIVREEKASVAIASNESFSGWTKTFTDPRLCAAIVDRITFGGNIIETGTDSYRLAQTRTRVEDATHPPS